MALAKRNTKDTWLDLIQIGLVLLIPPAILLGALSLGKSNEFFTPVNVAPGILLFGFSLMSLGAGMLLSKDREKAFLSRLLTAPLRAKDFILAYSLPYIPIALVQFIIVYGLGVLYGMELNSTMWLAFLILSIMAIGFIGLGMVLGTACSFKTVSIAWMPVSVILMLSGSFGTIDSYGEGVQAVVNVFPFTHALEATRAVMVNGAGFGDIATDLLWVTGWAVGLFVVGIYLFKRNMTE